MHLGSATKTRHPATRSDTAGQQFPERAGAKGQKRWDAAPSRAGCKWRRLLRKLFSGLQRLSSIGRYQARRAKGSSNEDAEIAGAGQQTDYGNEI